MIDLNLKERLTQQSYICTAAICSVMLSTVGSTANLHPALVDVVLYELTQVGESIVPYPSRLAPAGK